MESFLYCLGILVWAIRFLKAISTIFTLLSKESYSYDSHFICIHISVLGVVFVCFTFFSDLEFIKRHKKGG